MKILLAAVQPSGEKSLDPLLADYLQRSRRYATSVDTLDLKSEAAFLERLARERAGIPTHATLLDSRGKQLSSTGFAEQIDRLRESGKRQLLLAIGPPDGWSKDAMAAADSVLSLGLMTLPHHIARLVLAEQVYRAFTILNHHPYHAGH